MDDLPFRTRLMIAIPTLILCFSALGGMLYYAKSATDEFYDKCIAAGGDAYFTRTQFLCVKKNSLINID